MKSVLISIQPKWCELIASGDKKVEVRKTRPKIDVPFKCYIYCTNSKDMLWILRKKERFSEKIASIFTAKDVGGATKANGKVIGEFVCDKITGFQPTLDLKELNSRHFQMVDESDVNMRDLYNYANGKYLYGWHISNFVIYDKPKELSEFRYYNPTVKLENGYPIPTHEIKRPPQSWCYVDHPTEKGGV